MERLRDFIRTREAIPILVGLLEILSLIALLNIETGRSSLDINQRPFSNSLANHVKEVTRFVYPLWD